VAVTDPDQSVREMVDAIDEAGLRRDGWSSRSPKADRIRDVPHLSGWLERLPREGFRVGARRPAARLSTLNLAAPRAARFHEAGP